MNQDNTAIISAAVYDPETVTENGAENDPNAACARLKRVKIWVSFFALPIAEIVIGAIHHYDCPQLRMVPIFLEVLGCFTLPLVVNFLFPSLVREPVRTVLMYINVFFLLGWFIAGNIWTFQSKDKNLDCNNVLFVSTVVFILIHYAFMFAVVAYNCIYWCGRVVCKQQSPQMSTDFLIKVW
ncbi:uncharacterized protein V6R79_022778 [Siganus canaliculatus]